MAESRMPLEFREPPVHTGYSRRVCQELRATPGRAAAFARLRAALPAAGELGYRPEFADDLHVVKWLRARDYVAEAAAEMVAAHQEWRRVNGVDEMRGVLDDDGDDTPELIRRYHTGGRCGSDREGRPVFYDPIGRFDMSGLMRRHSLRELVLSRVRLWERLLQRDFPEARRRTGRPVCQAVYVMDMAGFGRRQMNLDGLAYVTELARVLEANYPELLGAALVLNPYPRISSLVMRLLGPFMRPATRAAIRILPAGDAGRAALLEIIEPDELPAVYGGRRVDPADGDPSCRGCICYGGPVPRGAD